MHRQSAGAYGMQGWHSIYLLRRLLRYYNVSDVNILTVTHGMNARFYYHVLGLVLDVRFLVLAVASHTF